MLPGNAVSLQLPNYWAILNQYDQCQYNYIRAMMSAPSCKNQRNKRVETFTDALEVIKSYAVRGDADDWRRCLVCGVFWLNEGIAINTRQLRLLIFKCKSSINGSLQKMGYTVNLGRTQAANLMVAAVPSIKENPSELRQWTVRQKGSSATSPSMKQPADLHTSEEVSSPEIYSPPEVVYSYEGKGVSAQTDDITPKMQMFDAYENTPFVCEEDSFFNVSFW